MISLVKFGSILWDIRMRLQQSSEWKAEVETQTERKVRYLQSDGGGEYKSKELEDFHKAKDITRHFTTPYTQKMVLKKG